MAKSLMRRREWQPFRELEKIRGEMDRLWGSWFEGRKGGRQDVEPIGEWAPALDLSEKKDHFVVKAEVPGIEPKDLDISLNDGMLMIRGEKKQEKEEKDGNYYFLERDYGAFSRSVRLPGEVRPDRIKASHKDGVLTILLPKSEEAKKKEIKIRVE